MSIFRITSLIVVLMGLLDFKSCPYSVEKTGVTETQVIDFVESLKNEGKNPLEYAEEISKIAKMSENVVDSVSSGLPKEDVVTDSQEQSQTEIQIPQVPTEGIAVVEVPAQVGPVFINPPVEIEHFLIIKSISKPLHIKII